MRSRVTRLMSSLLMLFVLCVGSQAAYTGVPVVEASTQTPGYIIPSSNGMVGILAYMSTGRNFSITSSPYREILLGHSMRAPNSCLEVAMAHHRHSGGMQNSIGIGQWCGGGSYIYFQVMDTTWADKYARVRSTVNYAYPDETMTYDDEMFRVMLKKTSASPNCWSAYLYNYNTTSWDIVGSPSSVCGTPSPTYGWVVFDLFDFNVSPYPSCGAIGTYNVLQTREIMKQTSIGGSWSYATASDLTQNQSPGGHAFCNNSAWWFNVTWSSPYGIVMCSSAYNANCD